jgi:hypothetical protein
MVRVTLVSKWEKEEASLITLLYMASLRSYSTHLPTTSKLHIALKTLQFIFPYYTPIARNIYKLFSDSKCPRCLDVPEYQFADTQTGVIAPLR